MGAGGDKVLVATGFTWETWNTGWILREGGSRRRRAEGLITLTISYGPTKRGASFREKNGEVKVPGEKPYLLPQMVVRGRSSPPVGGALDPVRVRNHGLSGQSPHAPTPAELGSNRGHFDPRLLRGEKGRLVAEGTLEG